MKEIVSQQQANGLKILDATLPHVLAVESLPAIHNDPFDRLLVAQATSEGAKLITSDRIFSQYPVSVLW